MNEPVEELVAQYVLDQLEPRERTLFEARLEREPALVALVREYESALAESVRALPRREAPAQLFSRIEERIEEERMPTIAPSPARTPAVRRAALVIAFPWGKWAGWGLAAVIAVSLATLAIQGVLHRNQPPVIMVVGLGSQQNTFAELPFNAEGNDSDARFIQLASLAENFWKDPKALPLPANGSTGRGSYALFDPASRQGFIAVRQLPVPADNRRYHLWMIDPATGAPVDAGVIPVAGGNGGFHSFQVRQTSEGRNERPRFFITIEDAAADEAQPKGEVVLGQRI